MSARRTVMTSTAMVAVVGVGWGLWLAMAPQEEKRRDRVKNMPKLNPIKIEEMKTKDAAAMQVLKEAAEGKDNMARDIGGPLK